VNFVVVYFSEQAVINCAANESKHDVRLDPIRTTGQPIYVLCNANNQKLSSLATAPVVTHEHILLADKNLNTKTPQKLYTGRGG